MDIGKRIAYQRECREMTQRDLAQLLNMSQSVLNRIEMGTRPARDTEIRDLSQILHVSADYLLGLTESTQIAPGGRSISFTMDEVSHIKKRRAIPDADKLLVDGLLDQIYERTVDAASVRSYEKRATS